MQEQEENFQPKDIAACRSAHDAAMAELAPPAPAPAPAPAPRAAAADVSPDTSRTFLVFFDWDSYVLTDGAKSVVATASREAGQMGRITMVATGHADRSGTDTYNIDLSRRRAEAVKAELVRLGTPAIEIAVESRGEAEPLVPTGDNVRKAQNRRVQIVMR
ncbi:MAG: OmpA family protein [Alphaproteobacteria bacterium]|nr:OmpA family protein [Alphaproteobacteria bacterium]